MVMRGWRAWYADGETYDSAETPWPDLPAAGMVGVVVYMDPPYRRIVEGGDWYWEEDGEIHRVKARSEWGEWEDAPDVECDSCLKRSGAMDDDAWRAVQSEMMGAHAWP